MLEEIIIAFQSFYRAHLFIRKHRLWKWVIIPGIIYALLFVLGIYFFWQTASSVSEFLFNGTGIKNWLKREDSSFIHFVLIFGQLALQLILLLFYFSLFKYLYLILGAPFFSVLSEKSENILLKKTYSFSQNNLLAHCMRGMQIALRNLLWQTVYLLAILLLTLIPVIGWITPLFALIIECYYLGFSMLDYTNERHNLSVWEGFTFVNHHKGLAIGNGLGFYLFLAVPVAGWILAPGYAVIAATLSLHQDEKSAPDEITIEI